MLLSTVRLPSIAALPTTLAVPAMLAPVPVTTNTVLLADTKLILPFTDGMFMLLVPLTKLPAV